MAILRRVVGSKPVSKQQKSSDVSVSGEHFNLRLVVIVPLIFVLASLSVGLLAVTVTKAVLYPSTPTSKEMLLLYLWIVGSSLGAGLLGGFIAYAITKPVRKAIAEAQQMIRYVEPEPPPVIAENEVDALGAIFDQARVSFVELAQAREMLDSSDEVIVALDKGGKVAGMNLRAEQALEVSGAEARHKSLEDLLGRASANRMLLGFAESALQEQKERLHTHVPLALPSGKEMTLSVKLSPLRLRDRPDELLGVVINCREQPGRFATLPAIVGKSPQLAEVLELVAKVAPTDSKVLIIGESGTGKELIADALHRLSPRNGKPFVKINCAAIPEGLLESELFGHEKGAFTGAVRKTPGKFELAHEGTILLDEIGEMSPATQVKVLRVVQEGEFTSVGGDETKKVNVRIVAATNRDLFADVERGRFREDLFYRLNVITLSMPPLRARKSDIPFLADHFLEEAAKRSNGEKKVLSRQAMDTLLAYSWPGNVRELENAIERACLLSNVSAIQPDDLPIPLDAPSPQPAARQPHLKHELFVGQASLDETMEAVEKELIVQALRQSNGVQVEAAKLLGLKHKNLWHKIKKHQIAPSDLKNSDTGHKNGQ